VSGAHPWRRRVLLVEDQQFMRVLVADLLGAAGFEVTAVGSAAAALDALDAFDPDALVTDVELGARPDGVELALIARRLAPHLGVVFLTSFPLAALGAAGHLDGAVHVDKTQLGDTAQLLAAVETALGGSAPPPPAPPGTEGAFAALTPHQRRVLSLLAAGLSNAEIAARTDSTVRAVERTVSRIFDALDVAAVPAMNPRVVAANLYNRLFGQPTAP